MKTKTFANRRRLPCLALGAALTLGATGAGAFPFYNAGNADSSTTLGEPAFGLGLNNAFDPQAFLFTFVDVQIELLPGFSDLGNIGVFDPEDAEFMSVDGTVQFTGGFLVTTAAESAANGGVPIGTFIPNGDEGTGVLNLLLSGVQYDAAGNFFFINGPAEPIVPGDASGSIELTSVNSIPGDFGSIGGDLAATPRFDESSQCANSNFLPPYAGQGAGTISIPGNLADADCFINLGLDTTNDIAQVVRFLLDQPIVDVSARPGLFCGLDGCVVVPNPDSPPGLTGRLVGAFDHGACDPDDPENTTGLPLGRAACVHYFDQPTNVGPAGKFTTFAPTIPEPATLALLGLGLLVVSGARRLA